MVYKFARQALDFLLPVSCRLCNAPCPDGLCLCPACQADLPLPGSVCSVCALPIGTPNICGRCLKTPPAYDAARAAFLYEPPVDRLIQQLKYEHRFDIARLFALRMHELLTEMTPRPDLIVPVPLHPGRLARRGHNQAWELARRLSRMSGIPASHRLCRRIQPTPSQTGLSARERRRNLRRAFAADESVRGRHVLVIDDVMTTGSTLDAVAGSLKRKEAKCVTAMIAARTRENSGFNARRSGEAHETKATI